MSDRKNDMNMADPVDTNALRENAVDLDPVMAGERISNTQWGRVHIAKRALFTAADEVDRLRAELAKGMALTKQYAKDSARDKRLLERDVHHLHAVIENAPHAPECEQWDLQTQTGRPLTDVCTCWKAIAL